jgi:hypothetical protein
MESQCHHRVRNLENLWREGLKTSNPKVGRFQLVKIRLSGSTRRKPECYEEIRQCRWRATASKPMRAEHTSSNNPTHQGHLIFQGVSSSDIPPHGARYSSKTAQGEDLKLVAYKRCRPRLGKTK